MANGGRWSSDSPPSWIACGQGPRPGAKFARNSWISAYPPGRAVGYRWPCSKGPWTESSVADANQRCWLRTSGSFGRFCLRAVSAESERAAGGGGEWPLGEPSQAIRGMSPARSSRWRSSCSPLPCRSPGRSCWPASSVVSRWRSGATLRCAGRGRRRSPWRSACAGPCCRSRRSPRPAPTAPASPHRPQSGGLPRPGS